MIHNRIALMLLIVSMSGCSSKPTQPAVPTDPCELEYTECVKQFATEKMYCLTSGETKSHCQDLYDIGLKECQTTHDKCKA